MDTAGTLYIVGTPLGNMDDFTLRGQKILAAVDIIAAEDTRVVQRLLRHYQISAPPVWSLFDGNERSRVEPIIEKLQSGKSVALVSDAGMPGVSDPGQRVVEAVIAKDIPVTVVPGPVAAITALVASGLATHNFYFVGFLPREKSKRQEALLHVQNQACTLIFYEAARRLPDTLADMALVLGGGRKAMVAREMTKTYESFVRGSIDELLVTFTTPPKGECTLVISGRDQPQNTMSIEQVESELTKQLHKGASAKDAATRLAVLSGMPRRQLYQLAVSIKNRTEESF